MCSRARHGFGAPRAEYRVHGRCVWFWSGQGLTRGHFRWRIVALSGGGWLWGRAELVRGTVGTEAEQSVPDDVSGLAGGVGGRARGGAGPGQCSPLPLLPASFTVLRARFSAAETGDSQPDSLGSRVCSLETVQSHQRLRRESRSKVVGLKDGRTNRGVLLCSRAPGGLGGVRQLTSLQRPHPEREDKSNSVGSL